MIKIFEVIALMIYGSFLGFAFCLLLFSNELMTNNSDYYYTIRTTQYNGSTIGHYPGKHVHKKGFMYTHVKLIKYHAYSPIEHNLQEICIYQSGDMIASERVGDGVNNNDQY